MKSAIAIGILTTMLALSGCQEPSTDDAPVTTTPAATTTSMDPVETESTTTSAPTPERPAMDPASSRLTLDDCDVYHVSTTLPDDVAQRIVPDPYVAESTFPVVTDVIVTHFQCEAILLDNMTMATGAGLSFFGVGVRPPDAYDDESRIALYDVGVYSDSQELVDLFARLGHAPMMASDISIASASNTVVKAVRPDVTPYEWTGASGGTDPSEFLEEHRRFFMDQNGSLWMDLNIQREAASIIPLEPGSITWSGGPFAALFDLDAGSVEGFGVHVTGYATATFARAPDYP